MASKIKSTTAAAAEAVTAKKKTHFGVAKKIAEATSKGTDIENFKPQDGSNYVRILTAPIPVRKHWDTPESAEALTVPCRKWIVDQEAFAEDPQGYLDTLEHCEYCAMEAEIGGKGGFYNASISHVVKVLVGGANGDPKDPEKIPGAGGEVQIWEIGQSTIVNRLEAFELEPDYEDMLGECGVIGTLINVKKDPDAAGSAMYSVGPVPKSIPLTQEQVDKWLEGHEVDLVQLKKPPSVFKEDGETPNPEGIDKWAEILKKCGEPKDGEKPHARKKFKK